MTTATAPIRKALDTRPSRWALARQSFVSLSVVLACYWMYWFLAVPLIEPTVDEEVAQETSEERVGAARETVTVRQRELAQYFSPDDWEAKDPAIWQSGQMRLVFQKLEPQPDGTVELQPCTLMFFPKTNDPGPARPIIMRAVEGAVVQFDERIVLRSVDLSKRRFLGGKLRGEIRIAQRESAPGAGDDLEIMTRNVQMSSDRAWTPEPVHFRMGRSRGSGRDLEIKFASAEPGAPAGAMRGLTMQSLELKRDVRMRLEMGSGPLADSDVTAGAPQSPARQNQRPIEITCQGSFEFDMQDYAASFHQDVDVFLLNPAGESDQLNCQLLTVYFARPGDTPVEGQSPESGAGPRSAASQVRLIEARGNPVTMRSPAQAMYARCRGVDYLPGPANEPGSLVAFGPGVIQGNLPDDPAGKYTASWARELRFEPDGALYRAALHGAATIEIGQMGQITADEVFAWLSKKSTPAASQVARGGQVKQVAHKQPAAAGPAPGDAWQIERVVARRYQTAETPRSVGDVKIKSAQLYAETNLLEAVVVRTATAAVLGGGPAGAAPARGNPQQRQPGMQQNPTEQFEVHGRSVQIKLVPRGEQLTIASATIDHDAKLEQWNVATSVKRRLLMVKGDHVEVTDADNDATHVKIKGQLGYVEAQGMSLWGEVIELEKKSNRLWINGPGQLVLPVTQDFDGKQLARPEKLTVDWKKGMNFQSDTAIFTGKVVARSAQQVVNTETLEATLNRAVDFSNPNLGANANGMPAAPGDRIDLAALRTRGWTFLEGRQLDEQGQQTSLSQMAVNDLSIDRTSGDIGGTGPGWVKHVSLGAPQPVGVPGQKPPEPKPGEKDKLTYLHVDFRRGITGNLNRREVKFFDQTKTIYGPVADWGDELTDKDLSGLGATGMSLASDALEVREMNSRPDSKRGFFELDATGSIFAEGQRFAAQGSRLTYAEQNDQLALHGEPAELFVENQNGGPRQEIRAKQVQYWFKDHRVWTNGANLVNMVFPGAGATKPKPAVNRPPADAGPIVSPPSAAAPPINALPPSTSALPPR